MAHIVLGDANAWLQTTKLSLSSIDQQLEQQVSDQVISQLAGTFDTSTWTNDTTTPRLVKSIIAMLYVSWIYDRTYSDDDENNDYARLLRRTAEANIEGLIAGTFILEEDPDATADQGRPSFFPNDASSANEPSADFPSDGGPAFMMGTVW